MYPQNKNGLCLSVRGVSRTAGSFYCSAFNRLNTVCLPLPTAENGGGCLGPTSTNGALGHYKVPILYNHKPSKVGSHLTSDSLGKLMCPVVTGRPANYRSPWFDMSGIPLRVPVTGEPLFYTTLDLEGPYVLQRKVLLEQAIPNTPKKGKSGTRFAWCRQHWSYFHLDVNLLRLLWLCAGQLNILYNPKLAVDDPIKYNHGVRLVVVDKLGNPVVVWLPKAFMSYLTGMLMSDAYLAKNADKHISYIIDLGPSPLAMDLAVFSAAILQMCGLGKGYMVLRDYWFGSNPKLYPGLDYMHSLSHIVRVSSVQGALFDHLYADWYNANSPSNSKIIKVMPLNWLNYLDTIALAFLMLGDGGNDSRGVDYNTTRSGVVIPARTRVHLAMHSFNTMERQAIANHLHNKVLGSVGEVLVVEDGNTKEGLLKFRTDSALHMASLTHTYMPNSSLWKMTTNFHVDKYTRQNYISAELGMDLLNKAWVQGDFSQASWDRLVTPYLHPVDMQTLRKVTPNHISAWHSYQYCMDNKLYNKLNHKPTF